jgi:hypothetical protein
MDVKDCQDAALVLGLYVQPGYFRGMLRLLPR